MKIILLYMRSMSFIFIIIYFIFASSFILRRD